MKAEMTLHLPRETCPSSSWATTAKLRLELRAPVWPSGTLSSLKFNKFLNPNSFKSSYIRNICNNCNSTITVTHYHYFLLFSPHFCCTLQYWSEFCPVLFYSFIPLFLFSCIMFYLCTSTFFLLLFSLLFIFSALLPCSALAFERKSPQPAAEIWNKTQLQKSKGCSSRAFPEEAADWISPQSFLSPDQLGM